MNRYRSLITAGATLGAFAVCGITINVLDPGPAITKAADPPEVLYLVGTVRDFRERTVSGGHTDFERKPDLGFDHYMGNISPTLGENGKPLFVGGGYKVTTQYMDSAGRPICYTLFDADQGDVAGIQGGSSTGGIQSAESFSQWYRDIPGVNLSEPLTLTLVKGIDGSYVFDDKLDTYYMDKGGFFCIDDKMFGNSGGTPDHNFHFTFELHTEFTYDENADQVFQFIGDDDVFVFIDGKLVIDIGGVHVAKTQYVDLNRLGLEHGKTYPLDFFYAERHRTQANFRIQTNIVLKSAARPTMTTGYD